MPSLPNYETYEATFPNASRNLYYQESIPADVSTPSSVYQEMWNPYWKLVEDILEGTYTMRKRGKEYLPQMPKETDEAYQQRLAMSYLVNIYARTLQSIPGLAFIKDINVTNVPDELKYLESNVDGSGRSITEFAYDLTFSALHYGITHAYCDFPNLNSDEMSLAEFRASGSRPYFTEINPRNVIGWRTNQNPGSNVLQQVRITEAKVVPTVSNEYLDKNVFFVRVVHPTFTEIWMNDPETTEGYELQETIENTLGYIPMVTGYGNRTGFMQGTPAMWDLAQLNLRHYQSYSDQNYILHIARVPFLFMSGFDEDDLQNSEIGAGRAFVSSNTDADIKYVEHTGKAIDSGFDDLDKLMEMMGIMGGDMLISRGVGRMTATARRIDQNESLSVMQLALRSVEQMIEQLYQIAGDWMGVDASDVHVSIGDDLSIVQEPNPTNALVALWNTGLITDEQAIQEAKRQGILSSYFQMRDNHLEENTSQSVAERNEPSPEPNNPNDEQTNESEVIDE